jgi:cytidine deaminase
MTQFSEEDAKLVTLARGARSRVYATSGAAVRDTTGRTYASANVNLDHLTISAIALACANAVASGATGLEAVVLCGNSGEDLTTDDLALVTEIGGTQIPVHIVDSHGSPIGLAHS